MNIVLLSGGSGQRLWPLSNSVRSKQFIKLFKNPDGQYESMVQRVYRQIIAANPQADITIATSHAQVSAIRGQLGSRVSVCVEPCRRDTFPAIALAAAFLHYEKGKSKDDVVIVSPVDPYADDSFFQTLCSLDDIVRRSRVHLTLVGISPSYPSEKYGYIFPAAEAPVSPVQAFREKPDAAAAAEYLRQNALWNAGIFAFKLGYLLEKSHALLEYTDYQNLLQKYDSLPQISFDYAVVEKETSIQVVRFAGEWKDIGTWNTITDVMSEPLKGRVTADSACQNLHVINELELPMLCVGCRNLVVAASADGILVADRDGSARIKPYVERLHTDPHFKERSWGTYTVIDVQRTSLTVKIHLQAGRQMTYHAHERRREIWNILSGSGYVMLDGVRKEVRPGDVVQIPISCRHTLQADTDMDAIEIQLGEDIDVRDKF